MIDDVLLWDRTDLSTLPPALEVSASEVLDIPFSSEEAEFVGAEVEITEQGRGHVPLDGLASITPEPGAYRAVVRVSGLRRGRVYNLKVTFMREDETSWSRVLALLVVA